MDCTVRVAATLRRKAYSNAMNVSFILEELDCLAIPHLETSDRRIRLVF